jgi:hypothetical protein
MKYIIVLLFFASSSLGLSAQSGDISGKVRDENGQGVVATVAIVDSLGTSTGRATKTDADGNYSLSPLVPGHYNLQVICKGHFVQIVKGILVSVDKATFIDFSLKPDPNAPADNKTKKLMHRRSN